MRRARVVARHAAPAPCEGGSGTVVENGTVLGAHRPFVAANAGKFAPILASPRPDSRREPPEVGANFDCVVIGSGVSGMATARKLVEANRSVRVFEKGTDVGGTWYWNRYPGCAVDVESKFYSFSEITDAQLQEDWDWPMKYSRQATLMQYMRHTATRWDIYKHIRLSTEVTSCKWDEGALRWEVRTNRGDAVTGRHLVLAIGSLSMPQIPRECAEGGLEKYQGRIIHSSRWPSPPDGSLVEYPGNLEPIVGKRVGIVGTGATAVQIIPQAAKVCPQVTIFQRTPPSVSPQNNAPITDQAKYKRNYVEVRKKFNRLSESLIQKMGEKKMNDRIQEMNRQRIRKTVTDPVTAEALCPYYPYLCKRPCILDDFYENFNLPNVELVDVKEQGGVKEFAAEGPVVRGKTYPVDVLIFATGFDALGGSNYSACGVEGVGGEKLHEKYHRMGRPTAMYGVHTAGFPNMYIMQGPHSPSVLSNMIHSSEVQANYAAAACAHPRVEVTEKAEMDWVNMSEEIGENRPQSKCSNWYTKLGNAKLQVYTGSIEGYYGLMQADIDTGFSGENFRRKA